jgi:hypothetical protein
MGSDKENADRDKAADKTKSTYEVTAQGSLGLLALGSVGITAWRKKREEEKKNAKPESGHE